MILVVVVLVVVLIVVVVLSVRIVGNVLEVTTVPVLPTPSSDDMVGFSINRCGGSGGGGGGFPATTVVPILT